VESVAEFVIPCVFFDVDGVVLKLDGLGGFLVGGGVDFLVIDVCNLRGVVVDFLIDFLLGVGAHEFEILVGADGGHLVIEIHLFNFKDFVHHLRYPTSYFFLLVSAEGMDVGQG
jgi:hypothetical protein